MKNRYKKLLIFEMIIFVILILNSFVINILSGYKMTIFLFLLIFTFRYFFGFEKDRHRYKKDMILEVLIFVIIFLILYYLFGIATGFVKNGNYYTLYGITAFVIPTICFCFLKEFLRYGLMCKVEENNILSITIVMLFIFLDVTISIYHSNFSTNYNIFMFIALNLLPAISENIVFSYMTLKVGCKPIIIYELMIGLYQFLIPIVPNPNEYIVAIISFLLPMILGYRVYLFFKKASDEELNRNYHKKNNLSLIICSTVVMIIVYFTSGQFHYQALAIASGSMESTINKGDIVIIKKIDGNYNKMKLGQIIAYRKDGVIIVHRLVDIIKYKDKYYFYTKGDANKDMDKFIIEEDMIIGIVNHKVPYIGMPTVWLNNL